VCRATDDRPPMLGPMAARSSRSGPADGEDGLLASAKRGDGEAFRRLVEAHRSELLAHCYRMLGSFHDAEDALQETLLRAWRALPRFGGPGQLRPWLYKIATNVCLSAIKRRPKRVLPLEFGPPRRPNEAPGEPVDGPVWVEPYPDRELGPAAGHVEPESVYEQREGVELAFIAAVQHLPATQRAVLLLRDVLGFSARETAESLDTTQASVNSALQRARRSVRRRLPARSQQATLRELGDATVRDIVERYIDAWTRGDVDALAAMLAEDATFAMPPYPAWWRGRHIIAAFAAEPVHRYLPARANGQPANASYRWNPDRSRYEAEALEVLTLEGSLVKEMTAFMMPHLFSRFDLPAEIDP
jgi:RNA polymerase sigma-70 factor (ECF subfamily)